jgi:catalase
VGSNFGRLSRREALTGMAAVAAVAATGVGGLAVAKDWVGPRRLVPAQFADRFEQVYGRHDGFRRNHAKGVAATGTFVSSGAGAQVCAASVFGSGTVPVVARFSLSGGNPKVADDPSNARGLGLLFQLPDGQQWRTAMLNLPVFPDRTPEGFYDRILAGKPDPATGKPDPAVMSAFLARHPETAAAMAIIKKSPPTPGFADSTFRSLNAFIATDPGGRTRPIRWSLVPLQSAGATAPPSDPDRLFDALVDDSRRGPLRWRMMVTLAEPGDPTHDATLPWPADRRSIDAGVLTIDRLETEAAGNARDVNFDPMVLPDGLAPSDDPLPRARSAVYARSFDRRAHESKTPSEVNVDEVRV